MRYENNIIEHETLTILRIGVLAGIVTLNNANACGINWQRANPIPQEIQSLQGVTYGGGKFVATAGPNLPGGFLTSLDGINWIQTLRDGSDTYSDVTWGGNQFVAVGGTFVWDQDTVLTSPNGVTWTGHNAYLDDVPLYGVVWNGSRYVAVGGEDLFKHSRSAPARTGRTGTVRMIEVTAVRSEAWLGTETDSWQWE